MLVSTDGRSIPTGVDLADRTPMHNPQWYASQGLPLTSFFASYSMLYKSQTWVYVLVRKLATSAARLPTGTFERVSTTERKEAADTPYGQLIAAPNPTLGAKLLWLWVFSTWELYGESMLLKLRDDKGRVRELWPMHPANVVVRRNPTTGVIEYGYMATAQLATGLAVFPASEVVHFRGYNPENARRGLSPCEPLRQTLVSEDAMRRGQSALWRNGARPSVLLTTDKQLSEPALDRLKASWDAAHSGIDSWGKTAVLEDGVTPHVVQINPEDMQYILGRQLNREECCAAWDVPPPAVQILDRATFSNITEQMRSLYRETMGPRLEFAEDILATQLAPDFTNSGDLYSKWLMDEMLRGAFEDRIKAKAQAIGTGQMTPAESRVQENLPFIEGSDKLFINAALIPVNVDAAATAGGTETELVPEKIKGLTRRDARTIAGRLSRTQSVQDIDPTALLLNLDTDDTTEALALVRSAQARDVDVSLLRQWISLAVDTEDHELEELGV